jgi:hypothetical protein
VPLPAAAQKPSCLDHQIDVLISGKLPRHPVIECWQQAVALFIPSSQSSCG